MSIKSQDDKSSNVFYIDPSIVEDNQKSATIQKNYKKTYGLNELGINAYKVHRNLKPAILIEKAITNGEGILTDTGELSVTNGDFTDISPHNIYIIGDDVDREVFKAVREETIKYLSNQEVFIFDGFAETDHQRRCKLRVINELPSHNLFIRDILISPTAEELAAFGMPDFTILMAPGCTINSKRYDLRSGCVIMIDNDAHIAIIAGQQYSGDIRNAILPVINYILPAVGGEA
jgi:phosphoenolpyruvate carboxykinase (ATP)